MIIGKIVRRFRYIWNNRSDESKRKYLISQGAKIGEQTRLVCSTDALGTEPYLIEIGDNCLFSAGVKIITHDGGIKVLNAQGYFGDKYHDKMARVKIGSNVYLGTGALVMPGVEIGDNCVIGAYSVVTKSIPSNSVAVGIPVKVKKTLDEYYESAIESGQLFPTARLPYLEKRQYLSTAVPQIGSVQKNDVIQDAKE